MQKLLPPKLVLILIVLMTALHFASPLRDLRDRPVLAALIAVAGIVLLLMGSSTFRRIGTNIKTFNNPDSLVTAGVFRWSRNPMYLGFKLLLAGIAVGFGTLSPIIGPVLFFFAAELWYIPFEERKMEETFGENYLAYKRRVRRWI